MRAVVVYYAKVSILVLMEVLQETGEDAGEATRRGGFNPCSDGSIAREPLGEAPTLAARQFQSLF